MAAKVIIKWSLRRKHNSKSRSRRRDYIHDYDVQFNATAEKWDRFYLWKNLN